jgi:hypothetical protein
MSQHIEIRSTIDLKPTFHTQNSFDAFHNLKADVSSMRSLYIKSSLCCDHTVWHDLHELERTLSYAEEKMQDLVKKIS